MSAILSTLLTLVYVKLMDQGVKVYVGMKMTLIGFDKPTLVDDDNDQI